LQMYTMGMMGDLAKWTRTNFKWRFVNPLWMSELSLTVLNRKRTRTSKSLRKVSFWFKLEPTKDSSMAKSAIRINKLMNAAPYKRMCCGS
jgi:hypothetical protein